MRIPVYLLSVAGGAAMAAIVAVAAVGVGYGTSGIVPGSLEWIVVYVAVPGLALILALITFVFASRRIVRHCGCGMSEAAAVDRGQVSRLRRNARVPQLLS